MNRPLERFAATAYLLWPTGDRLAVTTPLDDAAAPLLAQSPLGAARSWYWRLPAAQRNACIRVAVAAWTEAGVGYFPAYDGPTQMFSPANGWRPAQATDQDAPTTRAFAAG